MAPMKYLSGYPAALLAPAASLLAQGRLGQAIAARYPEGHDVRSDRALVDYVAALKREFMRSAPPLAKVAFDSKLHIVRNALGTHTTISRVQGAQLKAKREIRVASLFKQAPGPFLKMIVVHELAHLKQREHDKAFYALCVHMEPDLPSARVRHAAVADGARTRRPGLGLITSGKARRARPNGATTAQPVDRPSVVH